LHDQNEALSQQQMEANATERNLQNQINALQSQLRDSDASLIRLIDSSPTTSGTATQVNTQQEINSDDEDDDVDEVNEQIQKAQDEEIKDLKKQVSDLTTRLSMGAEAYKEKFLECHKLEKKLKKMESKMKADKEKQETSSPAQTPSISTSSTAAAGDVASSPRPDSAGIMDTIEKLLISFADPDSEFEQQESVNLQQKELEKMRKAFQTEHTRYKKYKSLYLELKSNYDITVKHQTEITQLLTDQQKKYQITLDENLMLRQHISELEVSTQTEGSSIGGRGASETKDAVDDEVLFQDAPGDPMYSTSDKGSSSSGEETAETRAHIYQELSNKFNFCPDESDVAPVASSTSAKRSKPKPIKKKPVVSQQPIRSPPSIVELLETTVSQTHSPTTPTSSPKSSGEMRRRSSGSKSSKKKMKSSVKRRSHAAAP